MINNKTQAGSPIEKTKKAQHNTKVMPHVSQTISELLQGLAPMHDQSKPAFKSLYRFSEVRIL